MAAQDSGTERPSHGLAGVAATDALDRAGAGHDEQVTDHLGDRTDCTLVRYSIPGGFTGSLPAGAVFDSNAAPG